MTRRVVALAFDGFLLLDLAGPLGVLETAGHYAADGYAIELVSPLGGIVRASSGIGVDTAPFREGVGIDLLIVPGGEATMEAAGAGPVVDLVRHIAAEARRTASVCSGALLLAAAGLLDGKRVTTHWGAAATLRRNHLAVTVDSDCIFLEDGSIWTSAGVTAGIDLALALVERDHGFAVARQVAQGMVIHHRRQGGQLQHSAALELQGPDGRFGPLLDWVRERLHEPLGIERLAHHCSLSPRHFSRAFTAATGLPPAQAIEKLRVDRARSDVAAGQIGLETVARRHGFGSALRMRRAFLRILGQPPQALRRIG